MSQCVIRASIPHVSNRKRLRPLPHSAALRRTPLPACSAFTGHSVGSVKVHELALVAESAANVSTQSAPHQSAPSVCLCDLRDLCVCNGLFTPTPIRSSHIPHSNSMC